MQATYKGSDVMTYIIKNTQIKKQMMEPEKKITSKSGAYRGIKRDVDEDRGIDEQASSTVLTKIKWLESSLKELKDDVATGE